jgi:hypothetical protein
MRKPNKRMKLPAREAKAYILELAAAPQLMRER